jgi:hypothetical protein
MKTTKIANELRKGGELPVVSLPGRQVFHLLIEPVKPVPVAGRSSVPAGCIPLPPGPVALMTPARDLLELRPVAHSLQNTGSSPVLLEASYIEPGPWLLLVNLGGRERVRVNGALVPRFFRLKEKDCVRVDGAPVFHISIFHRPVIGSPQGKAVGRECPVCRLPVEGSQVCYTCPCGAVMHCEEDPDGLQCASLMTRAGCPACRQPVVLEEGFSYTLEAPDE